MILFSGLDSVIESLYLERNLSDRMKDSSILVNPEVITYLAKKIVIISNPGYSRGNIDTLVNNENTVISRVHSGIPGVIFSPYLPKLCMNILWNGQYLDYIDQYCYKKIDYYFDGTKLYFPKAITIFNITGDHNSLSSIGWVLYQIGENLYPDTEFKDLDIVKLLKNI